MPAPSLAAALASAGAKGYRRVRLGSRRASMGAAIALYLRLRFAEIAPLGGEFACFKPGLA